MGVNRLFYKMRVGYFSVIITFIVTLKEMATI